MVLHFDWHAFIVAGAIFLLSVFEAVGDLTATAMVSEQPIEVRNTPNVCAAVYWQMVWCL